MVLWVPINVITSEYVVQIQLMESQVTLMMFEINGTLMMFEIMFTRLMLSDTVIISIIITIIIINPNQSS
jgi:hypothetical protein